MRMEKNGSMALANPRPIPKSSDQKALKRDEEVAVQEFYYCRCSIDFLKFPRAP